MISNPASVLKVGDKVEVKIIAVDAEKNRISLSIRELLEEAADSAEETPETSEEE